MKDVDHNLTTVEGDWFLMSEPWSTSWWWCRRKTICSWNWAAMWDSQIPTLQWRTSQWFSVAFIFQVFGTPLFWSITSLYRCRWKAGLHTGMLVVPAPSTHQPQCARFTEDSRARGPAHYQGLFSLWILSHQKRRSNWMYLHTSTHSSIFMSDALMNFHKNAAHSQ
jgi:hypothetical protein